MTSTCQLPEMVAFRSKCLPNNLYRLFRKTHLGDFVPFIKREGILVYLHVNDNARNKGNGRYNSWYK